VFWEVKVRDAKVIRQGYIWFIYSYKSYLHDKAKEPKHYIASYFERKEVSFYPTTSKRRRIKSFIYYLISSFKYSQNKSIEEIAYSTID